MAYFTSPPNQGPIVQAAAARLEQAVLGGRDALKVSLIQSAYNAASLSGTYLTANTIRQIIDKNIVPAVLKAEGGWGDHPRDIGGPTMRGVTIGAFRGSFKKIFVDTNVPAIKPAALDLYNLKVNGVSWLSGDRGSTGFDLGAQLLLGVCNNPEVSQFFIYSFLNREAFGNPIATMAIDPYLGYLLFKFGWASGAGGIDLYKVKQEIRAMDTNRVWSGALADIPKVMQRYTKIDLTNQILSEDKAFPLALKLLQNKVTWILGNTLPGRRNEPFRKGWINQAVYNPDSSLLHRIVDMAEFFPNVNTTEADKRYLAAKAKYYQQTSITFPNL
jgi:hypothetical protein